MKDKINREKGIVYRTKDLNDLGISNYLIGKLIDQGQLIKVTHGIYALDDFKLMQITDINVIIENGVISLLSAAIYYELMDGTKAKCTITLDRNQKPPRIPYDMFVYIYTTSSLYDVGLNIIDVNGRQVKIYDLERTVCDILKHRNKYDKQLVNKIVFNYLQRDDCDIDKLIAYSKKLRIYNVVKQYLETLGAFHG